MFPTPTHFNNGNNMTHSSQAASGQIVDPDKYLEDMERRAGRAASFLAAHGFETIVQNGQRISINLAIDGAQMENVKWNEVFVGKIPRDMFEDQLFPFLMAPATVYKIRYMMDFSRSNRGFCFVQYLNTHQAAAAIKYLDGLITAPGKPPIGARMSFDNKRLFFSDLPAHCTQDKLVNALRNAEVGGIECAYMCKPARSNGNGGGGGGGRFSFGHGNRRCHQPLSRFSGCSPGYLSQSAPASYRHGANDSLTAYVHFESHEAATKARRLLLPGNVLLFGRKIKLDWAKSEIPADVAEILKNAMAAPPNTTGACITPNMSTPPPPATSWSTASTVAMSRYAPIRERTQSMDTDFSFSTGSPTKSILCDLNNNNNSNCLMDLSFCDNNNIYNSTSNNYNSGYNKSFSFYSSPMDQDLPTIDYFARNSRN